VGVMGIAVPSAFFIRDSAVDNLPTQVLHGHGLLGREDGLYGAVSFAYQG
jgi:hypothetical protein